jgi:hypothetical protein
MLRQAGVYFGDDLLDDLASDNLEGHSEAKEAVLINDWILSLSGGSWEKVPGTVQGNAEVTARIRAFLDRLRARPIAAWKDPRTIATFPVWKPHLEDYRIIATFRHPMSVAQSLQVRQDYSLDKGLALWAIYNQRLLRIFDTEPNVILLDYDWPEKEYLSAFDSVCDQLGLGSSDAGRRAYNSFLQHHRCSEPIQDQGLRTLYEALVEHARCWINHSQMSAVPDRSAWPILGSGLEENFEKLARITQLQNQLLQQQHSRQVEQALNLRDVIQGMADNQRLLLEIHKPLAEMQRTLLEMHKSLAEMHNWIASPERQRIWLRVSRLVKCGLLRWTSRLRRLFTSLLVRSSPRARA